MSNASRDRKISNFLGATSVASGAYFTYISNNTNYKILDSDFYSALGVTGTIVQDGAATGTPILNTAGSVNNIRNLEAGSGIKTSVSPENGATIEHDFIADTVGVELVVDLAADQPKFRSIVAGTGINVSSSNGTIQVALSATPASTKTIIVTQLSDFPADVGGVITLEDNTEYAIRNDITTSNRFVMGDNTVLSGSDSALIEIAYTGVGVMYTSTNKTWKHKNIHSIAATGTFIAFTGSGSEILQIENSEIDTNIFGSIGGFRGMQIDDLQANITTDGLTFTGSNGVMLVESVLGEIDAGTFLDLGTATFAAISITDCFNTLNGTSIFLDGAASSANIDAGGLGSVHNCRFFGAGTALQTITTDDIRWQFFINDDIEETHKDVLMSQIANATNTVITVAGTPVKLAGTWVKEHGSQFTTDATGKMTYIGIKDQHFDVTMTFSGGPVSGSNKSVDFFVAKNGAAITNSKTCSILSNGADKSVTVIWRVPLSTGDYIEAYVANNTDTIDMLITCAQLRVS